jgi:hypothetical protein
MGRAEMSGPSNVTRTPATELTTVETAWGFARDDSGLVSAPLDMGMRVVKMRNDATSLIEYVVYNGRNNPIVIVATLAQLTKYFRGSP